MEPAGQERVALNVGGSNKDRMNFSLLSQFLLEFSLKHSLIFQLSSYYVALLSASQKQHSQKHWVQDHQEKAIQQSVFVVRQIIDSSGFENAIVWINLSP